MSTLSRITRSDHVASLALPPGRLVRTLGHLQRSEVLLRIGLCATAAICMWILTAGWSPPFGCRVGQRPGRDVCARVAFSVPDPDATERQRKQKRSEMACTYVHDDRPLKELRSALKSRMFQMLAPESYTQVEPALWNEFLPKPPSEESDEQRQARCAETFARLQSTLREDSDLTLFARAVQRAFEQIEETGLLEQLGHPPEEGSQISVKVYPLGKPGFVQVVDVKKIRVAEVATELKARLAEEFTQVKLPAADAEFLAEVVGHALLRQGLPRTLTLDNEATQREYAEMLPSIVAEQEYLPGHKLVTGGQRITLDKLEVLRREHAALVQAMSSFDRLLYAVAGLSMYAAMFLFCGVYAVAYQPAWTSDLRRLVSLLAAAVVTIGLGRLCTGELWQAEVIPLLLFSMTMSIVFSRQAALLLTGVMGLTLCLTLGQGLAEFVLMLSTALTAVLLLNRVRSRTKLIYVGAGLLIGEPLGAWHGAVGNVSALWAAGPSAALALLPGAAWHGFTAVLAALIMTGLLPFIERLFGVQTDISLLELGDAAHPLLQELARRAPGTYNHSINVASLAEAAAESIGGNGLLVRVGAYFHDIGKVFKPGYFVENQGREVNRHESLLPAMSTLVIIAHVKDGADLARQHRLPQPIIDFIEQHHGTTLVEYFYQQAARQSEAVADGEAVAESSYRYPGPKPRTREAGVLMLADAAESASRTLVDPTPARIENLIESLAMKRLLDGQFDDCGITLQELRRIQESLIKSLTAVYHARVKYPDQQQTA